MRSFLENHYVAKTTQPSCDKISEGMFYVNVLPFELCVHWFESSYLWESYRNTLFNLLKLIKRDETEAVFIVSSSLVLIDLSVAFRKKKMRSFLENHYIAKTTQPSCDKISGGMFYLDSLHLNCVSIGSNPPIFESHTEILCLIY